MKNKPIPLITIVVSLFLFSAHLGTGADIFAENRSVSGKIVTGYRILPIQKTTDTVSLTVYRGDYIKFQWDGFAKDPVLTIPELSVEQKIPRDLDKAPYFKMKTAGTYSFTLGAVHGQIEVIDYQQPHYKEVTSREAAELIKNVSPLILDVRTPGEYKMGHLKNAVHIPVQELQTRWKELSSHKNERILIYCATGNRSTVASKILIDKGFRRIFNMRRGIFDWHKKGYPVVRP